MLYVKKTSNHPSKIIKQLPKNTSDRLSKNSSNKNAFHKSNGDYENALKQSGYNNMNLKYQPLVTFNTKQKSHRSIIWFKPPFSGNVSTNVAKKFLQLVDEHFPSSNILHKIFNRNSLKVSYCCTQNLGNIIKSHNKKTDYFQQSDNTIIQL